MALFNYASKEITLKVVYYGPGLSGKTTNLQRLHATMSADRKGKLLSLSTEADRTLFFDFLPVALGKIKDFTIRFQLYTVPGQVRYNATRKLVLKGADAVVFVADSQKAMKDQNTESFRNMRENLVSNNINPDEIPVVLQYNKRDLKNISSVDELNAELNIGKYPTVEASAVTGMGVDDTFKLVTRLLLKYISKKHNIMIEAPEEAPAPSAPRRVAAASQPKEAVSLVAPTPADETFPAFAAELPKEAGLELESAWPSPSPSPKPSPAPASQSKGEENVSWQDLMESTSAQPVLETPPTGSFFDEPEAATSFDSASITDMLDSPGGFAIDVPSLPADETAFEIEAMPADEPLSDEAGSWPSPGPAASYLTEETSVKIEEPVHAINPFTGDIAGFDAQPEPSAAPMPPPVRAVPSYEAAPPAVQEAPSSIQYAPQVINVPTPVISDETLGRIISAIDGVKSAVTEMAYSSAASAPPASNENVVLAVRASGDFNAKLLEQVLTELRDARKREEIMLDLMKKSEHALRAIAATVLESKEKDKKSGFKLFGK